MPESQLRTSDAWATRNGLKALESAKDGVQRCLSDVEETRMTLASGYRGSDGAAYRDLIVRWEKQCERILRNLDTMIEALRTNDAEVNKNQQMSNEAIRNAAAKAGGHDHGPAYNALMGA